MKWTIWKLENKSNNPDKKHLVPFKHKEGEDKEILAEELGVLLAKDIEFCMRVEND